MLPWLRWGTVALLVSLLLLDLAFPLPLPTRRDTSVLVTARDGSPLRAFADAEGVWRYPTVPEQVSALLLVSQQLVRQAQESQPSGYPPLPDHSAVSYRLLLF